MAEISEAPLAEPLGEPLGEPVATDVDEIDLGPVYHIDLEGIPLYLNPLNTTGSQFWYSIHVALAIEIVGRTPYLNRVPSALADIQREEGKQWAKDRGVIPKGDNPQTNQKISC